jgi:hypothetical protein
VPIDENIVTLRITPARWAWAAALLIAWPAAQSLPADLEPASLMTTPVLLYDQTREVSQGTGFFFASTKADGQPGAVFLVTNYHVVTGRQPQTSDPPMGDRIRFLVHDDPSDVASIRVAELPLYDRTGAPVWIASRDHPDADLVLVPVPPDVYDTLRMRLLVFTEAHTRGDIRIRPTSGATLLGYPYGFFDQKHYLPVWKTGHIASEPSVDFDGKPMFLVDVSAFPGMSGSPVLAVANGIYEAEDGSMRTGRVLKLLGVFAAMPVVRERRSAEALALPGARPPVEVSLQLGYVWKAALIADLARGYTAR